MQLFDQTMGLLVRVLDFREARQNVITANIANEETPGYHAKELVFVDALAGAMKGQNPVTPHVTHVHHIGLTGSPIELTRGRMLELPAGELSLDHNSVNLELELAKLSDNAGKFSSSATILATKFRHLIAAIRDTL